MLLGIDVGGTFTDAVLLDRTRVHTAKTPTTPRDQSEGVLRAALAVLEAAGGTPGEVERFAHGMTVATNALLEGRTARTALITTEGFEDLIELARQNRPALYRLCEAQPAPLTPPERRFGARERMTAQGPLSPLEESDAGELAERVAACEPEAVAVILLHSYRHPEHERQVREALAPPVLGSHVSVHLSSETVGTFREYERAATTEIDAGLSPLLRGYLDRLRARCREQGLPEPAIMQSNGGLIDCTSAGRHASWTVLSGPAGGAAAAAHVARAVGMGRVLCFDMGGTSCDICLVEDGEVQERDDGQIAGRPIALPMLAIHTVGAGGGSIAWRDGGGALRVGPASAGADPGPACYGRGGTRPTVTDANLLLGHLSAAEPLAGGVALDLAAARSAVGALAAELGLSVEDCAGGIVRVANAEMIRALRVVTVERGVDPREFTLMPFGGAGPLHAAAIAEELGIREILCPRESGVLAALGLAVSPRRRDAQRTVMLTGAGLAPGALAEIVEELSVRARDQLGEADADLRATYLLRYRGQAFELPVTGALRPEPTRLREDFEQLHEHRYGFRDPDGELELVTVRVTATVPGPPLPLSPPSEGDRRSGPLRIRLPQSTLVVPRGWQVRGTDGELIGMRRDA